MTNNRPSDLVLTGGKITRLESTKSLRETQYPYGISKKSLME